MDVLLEARQARFGKNQSLFRAVNEQVESLIGVRPAGSPVSFFCECANPDCGSQIDLSLADYEAIRQYSTQFFVLSDHVYPDVETVVDERGSFVIVDKFGAGGRVATESDARRSYP
jgi:hypothetical protein